LPYNSPSASPLKAKGGWDEHFFDNFPLHFSPTKRKRPIVNSPNKEEQFICEDPIVRQRIQQHLASLKVSEFTPKLLLDTKVKDPYELKPLTNHPHLFLSPSAIYVVQEEGQRLLNHKLSAKANLEFGAKEIKRCDGSLSDKVIKISNSSFIDLDK